MPFPFIGKSTKGGRLIKNVNESEIIGAAILSILQGFSSKPVALLSGSFLNSWHVLLTVTCENARKLCFGCFNISFKIVTGRMNPTG